MRVLNRRKFCVSSVAAAAAGSAASIAQSIAEAQVPKEAFEFKYMLASCLYGYMYVGEILPEVRRTGAVAVDLWPKVHGNQREQLDDLGVSKFRDMLAEHNITLGCVTQYPLGPFGLQSEMRVAQQLDCGTLVTGGAGPRDLTGGELKQAVAAFCEKMKPHLDVAAECDVDIAIENHGNNLIHSADSLKWLAEFAPSDRLGIALAPYHLPQDAGQLAQLIRDVGKSIKVFYAWQHGAGCMQRLPKDQELLQLPGRGDLDFQPLVEALADIHYDGWTEIFMHPFPRGIPILETTSQIAAELNRARDYLNGLR